MIYTTYRHTYIYKFVCVHISDQVPRIYSPIGGTAIQNYNYITLYNFIASPYIAMYNVYICIGINGTPFIYSIVYTLHTYTPTHIHTHAYVFCTKYFLNRVWIYIPSTFVVSAAFIITKKNYIMYVLMCSIRNRVSFIWIKTITVYYRWNW